MRKQTILYKISFAALFTALSVILSRFFSIPGLFGLSFLKISLANSVVMFASIYLGPVWGMIVGGASDTLGAILIPQGGGYNPIYTIPALLTGLFPYIFYKIFNKIKIDNKFPTSLTIVLSIFSFFILFYFVLNDDVVDGSKTYHIATWIQVLLVVLAFVLSIAFIVVLFVVKKKFANKSINKNYNIYALASCLFFTYMFIKIPIGSLIQAYMLNYSFLFILSVRIIAGFFTLMVHTIVVIILINVSLLFDVKSAALEDFQFKKKVKESE